MESPLSGPFPQTRSPSDTETDEEMVKLSALKQVTLGRPLPQQFADVVKQINRLSRMVRQNKKETRTDIKLLKGQFCELVNTSPKRSHDRDRIPSGRRFHETFKVLDDQLQYLYAAVSDSQISVDEANIKSDYSIDRVEEMNDSVMFLRSDVSAMENRIQDVDHCVEDHTKDIDDLDASVKYLEEKCDTLSRDTSCYQERISLLEQENTELRTSFARLDESQSILEKNILSLASVLSTPPRKRKQVGRARKPRRSPRLCSRR